MSLWPHQELGLTALRAAVASGETKICITSPTGGGKSRMMFELLLSDAASAAVYTDRRMLCEQLTGNMTAAGIKHGIIASGMEPSIAEVQLCMAQTMVSKCVKGLQRVPNVDFCIWDEAHKMGGDTLLELRKHHWRAIDIGFTATPLGIGHVYEHLIVAGTNSELRDCGALVPAFHFGPDEPDIKWVGQVKVDDGECGLPKSKRQEFAHRVFGRVVENYLSINPERKPTVLFAPGVAESIWFAQELCKHGIPAAHVDGDSVWLNGELIPKDQDLVNDVRDMLEDGTLAIVCNRFVLREGIDWPFVEHGIFATIFGSLTSYLQAGGRFLRACPRTGKTRCTIQDHGGNWHRHGSLNSDREWDLGFDDRIVAGIREKLLREKKEREPIVCPNCNAVRLSGPKCFMCGHQHDSRVRIVLQQDGTLREMKGDIYKARRTLKKTAELETEWVSRVKAVQKSQKPSVMKMTFSQLSNSFARDHNWAHPPEDLPLMPTHVGDWFRPVRDIAEDRLTR